jgi:hypothetical protein
MKNIIVRGIHMQTIDGLNVVGIDYDYYKPKFIEKELKYLQDKYLLGDFYILESSPKKYQAICFTKVSVNKYREMLQYCNCDEKFSKRMNYFGEPKVLRLSPKKDFNIRTIKVIKSNIKYLRESLAHKLAYDIENIISLKKTINPLIDDGLKQISMVFYETKTSSNAKKNIKNNI